MHPAYAFTEFLLLLVAREEHAIDVLKLVEMV